MPAQTTAAAPAPVTGGAVLAELLERGYTLSVETRVDVHDHKIGPHPVTYADQLVTAGPERVPDHLREAIVADKPLFLAAACVLDPPTPWLRELVRRCRTGAVYVSDRRTAPVGAGGALEYRITPGVLAANIAAFVGLDPIDDAPRIEKVIRSALRSPTTR
jgi:hypothetical protein